MEKKSNIVLIGLMGSGKTSVASLIEKLMPECSIADMDAMIEKREGITISEIFASKGEKYFRDLETELIKRLATFDKKIISTGGGVVESTENLDYLRRNGVVFYLSAPAACLYERIKSDENRPLLKTENPLLTLEELLEKRAPMYKTADYEIDVQNKTLNEIAEEIVEKYGK